MSAASTAVPPGDALASDAWLPIGELAQRTGVTTRTLRYWEEQGLIRPGAHRSGGERLYLPADMARVTRIRDLQELLGFSLAEVRVVLEVPDPDALDRVRSEYRWGGGGPDHRRRLLEEAIEANDRLLARLDESVARLRALRREQAAKQRRLTELLDGLGTAGGRTDRDRPTGPEEGTT